MPYQWSITPTKPIPADLLALASGDTLIARLLLNRNINDVNAAAYFLAVDSLTETSGFEIPEMDQAINRIKVAIDTEQKIIIYGDYDVDGTSSVALLYRAFAMIGKPVEYYIPNREAEGYGINCEAITKIRLEKKCDLLISCDCGISNYDEVKYAQSLGLDVIITDHHALPKLPPPSVANCNPKTLAEDHPLHYLPGVGVAYKLAQLLLAEYMEANQAQALGRSLLDLVALGIIADMAALKAENRLLAIKGLEVLATSDKPGLQELLRVSGANNKADVEHIGFGMAPRINAAGRLADAEVAVRLMITDSKSEAESLCAFLDSENRKRQILCNEITDEAFELIQNAENALKHNVIAVAHQDWHAGVIGIVASRLLDKFHLPVFVMAIADDIAKGSVRCINVPGLDIYEEMAQIQSETGLFLKFGGHKMAAGFSCKASDVDKLISAIQGHFSLRLADDNLVKNLNVDTALRLRELDSKFIQRIAKLAPYGIENRQPLFTSGPLQVVNMKLLGNGAKHIKLYVIEADHDPHKKIYEAVLWNRAEEFLSYYTLYSKPEITIVYTPKLNEFMGEVSLQLDIKDWQEPSLVSPELFSRFAVL